MAHPTPLRSFLGGLTLPIPVHSLLLLNGNVFGISGFVHRAARGSLEGATGTLGLVLGGILVSLIDTAAPPTLPLSLSKVATAGLLVGLGTKLANGCTSGHMICGLSRFSLRSLAATTTFFATGVATAQVIYRDSLPASSSLDWTLGLTGERLLAAQAIPLTASLLLCAWGSRANTPKGVAEADTPLVQKDNTSVKPNAPLRALGFLNTSIHFALALHLSNLTDANRVLAFLLLPFNQAFDPSLGFLAAGALPLAMILYHYGRGSETPKLGGEYCVPKGGQIDSRLILGSAIFGVGWGMAGICPGPALVNLGRAALSGSNVSQWVTWLSSMVAGGLLAGMV